ncbi:hypothetical protein GJ496_001801 [Pomphorhynchus laevis]|nr:hypothetical protein GJ496_001801 [Pomphorhynchus laevis]
MALRNTAINIIFACKSISKLLTRRLTEDASSASKFINTHEILNYKEKSNLDKLDYDVMERRSKAIRHSPIRGVNTVFDLFQISNILKDEQVRNIFCIDVKDLENSSCEYLLIGTCLSEAHLRTLTRYIGRLYRLVQLDSDPKYKTTDKNVNSWKVIYADRISIHLFSNNRTRELYDIEGLWMYGKKLDNHCNEYYKNVQKNIDMLNAISADREY